MGTHAEPVTEHQHANRSWIQTGFFVVLLLVCTLVLSRNHADPDFWGHVQYGRDALHDGLPLTATYSYTAIGYRWINHENLAELAFALGVDHAGPALLLTLKALSGLAIAAVVLFLARRSGVSLLPCCLIVLLTVLNLMHFWSLRPQLFSYLYFTVMLLVLRPVFAGWTVASRNAPMPPLRQLRSAVWGLPLLCLLWGNSHGGFVLGLLVLLAWFGLRSLQALWCWRRAGVRWCLALVVVFATAVAATCINPYGIKLHAWLLYALGSPRPEIIEWRPPAVAELALWWQWWVLVVVAAFAVIRTRLPRDPVEMTLLAVTLWQSLEHQRHIPFFALLFAFWLPAHLESAWQRMRPDESEVPLGAGWGWPARCAALAGMLLFAALLGFQLGEQVRRIPVHRNAYPVAAFQYMADQELQGRLVVRFKWAQYAIAAFGSMHPDQGIRVAFDGRFRTCYPQEIVDMYFDFATGEDVNRLRYRSPHSPPPDPARILTFARPDLVLIDRSQTLPTHVLLNRQHEWTLLYHDEIAQLWGRADKYDNPNSVHFVPPAQRKLDAAPQRGIVDWPALPVKSVHFAMTRQSQ